MPIRILSPYAVQGLQGQFVLPGPFSPVFGDEIYGTQDVGDLAGKSPYAARRIGAQRQNSAAAGVGVYSSLLVRPGAGTLFVVETVRIVATTTRTVQMYLCRPADVALLTIVLATPLGCLNAPVAASGFIPTLGATLTSTNRNVIATGGVFEEMTFAANSLDPYAPPRGIVLQGQHAESATALLIVNLAENEGLKGSVYGTEYVAPPSQIP